MGKYLTGFTKTVVILIAAFVLIMALGQLVLGQQSFPIPDGALNPMVPSDGTWEVVALEQDSTYGMFWFFLHNTAPDAKIKYCLAIVHPAMGIPVLFNWLEEGELKFLKFDPTDSQYHWDLVDDETYNMVAGYYEEYLGVRVARKSNC